MSLTTLKDEDLRELYSTYRHHLSRISYEERVNLAVKIAKPMASESLTSRLQQLTRQAWEKKMVDVGEKACLKRLLKEEETGILIIPGDVSPIDSVTHLQGICLAKKKPYCYVPTRFDLGNLFYFKVSLNCLYIRYDDAYKKIFNSCMKEVKSLPEP
ncbi:hypothetical protein Aperf_G00000027469 [Anoplocephala perfoliata]